MILQTSSRDYSRNERTVVKDSNILFPYESLNEKSIFSFIHSFILWNQNSNHEFSGKLFIW